MLMLSCRKATELMEKRLQFKLNTVEKAQLYLHTSMCEVCKTYQDQSADLDRAIGKHLLKFDAHGELSGARLPDEVKVSLIKIVTADGS